MMAQGVGDNDTEKNKIGAGWIRVRVYQVAASIQWR